ERRVAGRGTQVEGPERRSRRDRSGLAERPGVRARDERLEAVGRGDGSYRRAHDGVWTGTGAGTLGALGASATTFANLPDAAPAVFGSQARRTFSGTTGAGSPGAGTSASPG